MVLGSSDRDFSASGCIEVAQYWKYPRLLAAGSEAAPGSSNPKPS